jgi:hypothetical protein
MISNKLKIQLLIAFFLLSHAVTLSASRKPGNVSFSGVWSVKHCPAGGATHECAVFYLYLTQQGNRLCGEHFVATQGLSRLDEGDPGTVLGVVRGKTATLLIRSTRNDAWYMAEGEMVGRRFSWRRIGMAIAGKDDESSIIPAEELLSKNSTPEQLTHLKSVEVAPCHWPDQK